MIHELYLYRALQVGPHSVELLERVCVCVCAQERKGRGREVGKGRRREVGKGETEARKGERKGRRRGGREGEREETSDRAVDEHVWGKNTSVSHTNATCASHTPTIQPQHVNP